MIDKAGNKKYRDPSIELLRIIAMFFIMCSHYACHGQTDTQAIMSTDFVGGSILKIFTLGNLGVDIFMAIFGYFNIKMEFKFRRVLPLAFEVFFYSVVIFIIFCICNHDIFSIKNLIKALFPISFDEYGFPTIYIIVFIISPILNSGLIHVSKERKYLYFLALLWIVLPIFSMGSVSYYCKELEQYVIAYSVGALVRLNESPENLKKAKHALLCSSWLLILLTVLLGLFSIKIPLAFKALTCLYQRNSPIFLLITWALLIIFMQSFRSIPYSIGRVINIIAGSTFGIYLIHDNKYVRDWLWAVVFNNAGISGVALLGDMLLSVYMVFIVCSIIDLIRKNTLEKLFMIGLNKVIVTIQRKDIYF